VSGDAQSVRDPFDHVHVQQLPASGDHFAHAARGQVAAARDHRRIDARSRLDQPEDAAEVSGLACIDHHRVREQADREFL